MRLHPFGRSSVLEASARRRIETGTEASLADAGLF